MVLYDLHRTNAPLCLKKTSALFINYNKDNVNTDMTQKMPFYLRRQCYFGDKKKLNRKQIQRKVNGLHMAKHTSLPVLYFLIASTCMLHSNT